MAKNVSKRGWNMGRQSSYDSSRFEMIELHFTKRGALRKAWVRDRVITVITPELSYQPWVLDVNKAATLQDEYMTKLLTEVGIYNFEEYVDDEAIARDLIKDFQEAGWRCIKK